MKKNFTAKRIGERQIVTNYRKGSLVHFKKSRKLCTVKKMIADGDSVHLFSQG